MNTRRCQPIRVLHVVPFLGPGGMETGVMTLVTGCDPARVVSDVCTLAPATAFQEHFSGASALHELSRKSAFDLSLIRDLASIMRRRRVDVVHTHSWGTLLEGRIAARLSRVPHVVHGEHGTLETRPRNVRLQRELWRRADRLLAVSHELAQRMGFEIGVDPTHITVIANGVDVRRFDVESREDARRRLGLPLEARTILSIGRLVEVKNHELLLEAAAILREQGEPWTFLIAGEGPLRAQLVRRIGELRLDNVTLLGHRSDVPALLAACDALTITSRSEGMSNTILEAMAAARPVIATQVGSNAELVRDGVTGLLVPSGDARQLAAALASVVRWPARAERMGRAARSIAASELSIDRMIGRYSALYEAVTAGAAASR